LVLPDAIGLAKDGREHLLPYAATVVNIFGPDNEEILSADFLP